MACKSMEEVDASACEAAAAALFVLSFLVARVGDACGEHKGLGEGGGEADQEGGNEGGEDDGAELL